MNTRKSRPIHEIGPSLIINIALTYLIRSLLLVVLLGVRVLSRMIPVGKKVQRSSLIAIESGINGWQLIEYEELYESAIEYISESAFKKITITTRDSYFNEVRRQIGNSPVTHYFYDPRTGPESYFRALCESIKLSIFLTWRGIVPIARLTDVPHRQWRLLCIIITSLDGICLTLMCPNEIKPLFPHRRIYGPMMMPFSMRTLRELDEMQNIETPTRNPRSIGFSGSIYEPRASFLSDLEKLLVEDQISLKVTGRNLGAPRLSSHDYWKAIKSTSISITTADQLSGPGIDRLNRPHLIYRYTEALTCKTTLVATDTAGCWKYFRPGVDFVPFSDIKDAQQSINTLVNNPTSAKNISDSGHQRVSQLICDSTFWRTIDLILGPKGFVNHSD